MAMAASSTFAAANPGNKSFAIFINHRGIDVKETFARSLYLRLFENGLTAFLDKEEMQAGYHICSQIEQAVKAATVHVAILSPHYAESYWCLKELVMMLDSKRPIIPVFYRVTPAQVKWTQGDYAKAIQTHEKKGRHDPNTIRKWRDALFQVSNISGFELETRNGEELQLELLDKVVKRLCEMVKKPADLYVAKFPTGLHEKLKDLEETVLLHQQQSGRDQILDDKPRQQSCKPQILGIVGLGGLGKTTLAKEFFNKKKSYYDKSCFLSDVRDHEAKGSLISLQRKLLKSLIGLNERVLDNVDEGKEMLVEALKSSKALVVLDDVDHVNQVDALLPLQTHFDICTGSLILITCRDRHVLISSRIEKPSIFRLTELSTRHSRELFCSHAFNQTYPLPGFESLVDMFLKSCNGLPLSLKVFGAHLYGKDIAEWEDELESFQQILPAEIQKTFLRSYESLDQQEKQMFLDIACFLIGTNRDTAIEIWNRSGWRGRQGFQNLQNKCLVEVDSWNAIHMHDHVRDLRINIVPENISPRRLWRRTKNGIDNVLSFENIAVRGIRMVHGCHDEDDVSDIIGTENARLRKTLQILDAENSLLEGILRRVELPNLLWLSWKKCPHSSLPSWVPTKNLRVLKVSESISIRTLWHREGESQALLQSPVCLEELWADGSVQLKSIRGLEQCTKLRILNIRGCCELEELPSLETLVWLEGLRAEGCVKLKSVKGLEKCTKLRILNIRGCSELEELPNLKTMVSLEELRADRCVKLKSIRGLAQCTELRKLIVNGCSELEELSIMKTMVSMEELWAESCQKLKRIGLAQATKLRYLIVSDSSELEELPSMETFVSLEKLVADRCVKLKSIRGLTQCTKLTLLSVSGCSELEELPSMETLISLEWLWLNECVKLKSIAGLAQCTKLRKLIVNECSDLEELPRMETLVSLEELWAEGCVKLKSIGGLAQATKLRYLIVSMCYELEELPSMETLICLEKLVANGCVKLKIIRGLWQLTKLRKLSVQWCFELEELEDVEHCTWLETRSVSVSACPKLQCPVFE